MTATWDSRACSCRSKRRQCQKKVSHFMEAFPSQRSKRWFEQETFLSLMRLRGMECNAPSGYAEAFYCRKGGDAELGMKDLMRI